MRPVIGRILVILVALLAISSHAWSQIELQSLLDIQAAFEREATRNGAKSTLLEFLRDDAVVFQPGPTNGRKYWSVRDNDPSILYARNVTYSDIAANGLLGYTTGNWWSYQKGKSEGLAKFGQYVTIWERGPDGKFRSLPDSQLNASKYFMPEPVLKRTTVSPS